MKKRVLQAAVSLFAILMILSSCTDGQAREEYHLEESNKLVIYTSHKEEIYGPIVREFEERTGIWVEVVTGGTNDLLDRIEEENGKNSGDVMFGGGVDSLNAYQDYFEPYISSQSAELDDTYASSDGVYTVFSRLPTVIVYNKKLVISAGTPRSWRDLTNNHWQGNIAFADPDRSGSSYTALLTMIQILSEDMSKEEVMEAFVSNLDGDILQGSGEVLQEVTAGKKLIGITLEETVLKEMDQNADIAMIYPREGTAAVPDGTALIKNAPHRENAELFIEFTVSEDVQRLLEDRLYRRSVRKGAEDEEIREVFYDLEYSEKQREEILTEWKELTGQ
ncbi:MAG: ABC transporter substrate-binding protein [Lachnospiraceae bacterium]|nr:ABC transporter substrate-binding protein [Lachnospiraceae bacterium]